MDIAILGRIGYDLYSEEPHVPLPQVRRFSRYLGGSSANMAVGLARLGARVGIVSCLGTDSLSRYLIDFLQSENVDTSRVTTEKGYLPSLAITEVSPPDRFPQVFYRREPADALLRCPSTTSGPPASSATPSSRSSSITPTPRPSYCPCSSRSRTMSRSTA